MSGKIITRREFLKMMGASSLLMSLPMSAGCPLQQAVRVSLVKDSDDAYAIRRAIELAGDLDFLASGDSLLLKVALNFSDPFPATTSPLMVSELITLLKDRGAGDVFVGDRSPSWMDTMNCMEETGIYQAALDAGAEVVVFEEEDMVHVEPELAIHWPEGFSIPNLFNEVDHIISLPTLRAHRLAGFTMGVKNFVGAMPQDDRFFMHGPSLSAGENFMEMIAEIPLCTDKIRLSVLDAREGWSIVGLEEEYGTLITPGIVIASKSLVGADAVGLALLKSVGTTSDLMETRVWDHPVIKRAVEVYCPNLSCETMALQSEGVENIDEIKKQLL